MIIYYLKRQERAIKRQTCMRTSTGQHISRQMGIETDIQTETKAESYTHSLADRQAGRQIDRQSRTSTI